MMWLDLFLSTIVVALGWCTALVLALGLLFVGFTVYVQVTDWMDERQLEAWRRSPYGDDDQ